MGWGRAVLSAAGLSQRLQPRPCWADIQAVSQAAQGLGLLSLVGSGSNPSKLSLK